MENAIPNKSPLPPAGTTETSTSVDVPSATIDKAAAEGRLSIRPQDLTTKVIEELATKFDHKAIVKKIESLMESTKTMAIGGRPLEVPDFKTQLDTLKLVLQYQIGMPVARTESVVHNVDTMQTLEKKMTDSPALRRAVGRMLDRAKTDDGEPLTVEAEEVTEGDLEKAEEVLQAPPDHPETPVEAEITSRPSMRDILVSRGTKKDPGEKYQ